MPQHRQLKLNVVKARRDGKLCRPQQKEDGVEFRATNSDIGANLLLSFS